MSRKVAEMRAQQIARQAMPAMGRRDGDGKNFRLVRRNARDDEADGFLSGSQQPGDYGIGGMNLSWELPGTFDVELEIRNLSLKLTAK